MKESKIIALFFFVFLFLAVNKVIAVNGQECNQQGGNCRVICYSDETAAGSMDCPTYNDGTSEQTETCCKKGSSGCKGDSSECSEPKECCSGICEFDSHRNKKICNPQAVDTPPPKANDISCDNDKGVITALGCIPTNDMNSFAGWLLSKAILIAGGIAFILMSIGIFQITTSAGDPKKVQAGSELITSTLSGLLFIILSVFLLKLIGVDVLHLPGL